MRSRLLVLIVAAILVVSCKSTEQAPATAATVEITTTIGSIVVLINHSAAPITSANFMRYVDESRFDSAQFYRTVTVDNQPNNQILIEVIQGGLGSAGSNRLAAISHETTRDTGLRHLDGTISMARSEPGSASSEFFICIGDQPELDFGGLRNPDGQGFAVFGQVISGMEVVQSIHASPRNGQSLTPPIEIVSVRRLQPEF
ncbi:MAG: peptidylprolyl isomerase [Rhodothermales bacterium]|nr:peptidylprolyl isomerase [Rhodothermales bacterium]